MQPTTTPPTTQGNYQGHPTVRFGEYLFGRPEWPEIFRLIALKTRDFIGKHHLRLS